MLPYMQFCAATPLQEAMCIALVQAEQPYQGHASYYDWLRQQYAAKRARLEEALHAAGIRTLRGEGGFFLIGDISNVQVSRRRVISDRLAHFSVRGLFSSLNVRTLARIFNRKQNCVGSLQPNWFQSCRSFASSCARTVASRAVVQERIYYKISNRLCCVIRSYDSGDCVSNARAGVVPLLWPLVKGLWFQAACSVLLKDYEDNESNVPAGQSALSLCHHGVDGVAGAGLSDDGGC